MHLCLTWWGWVELVPHHAHPSAALDSTGYQSVKTHRYTDFTVQLQGQWHTLGIKGPCQAWGSPKVLRSMGPTSECHFCHTCLSRAPSNKKTKFQHFTIHCIHYIAVWFVEKVARFPRHTLGCCDFETRELNPDSFAILLLFTYSCSENCTCVSFKQSSFGRKQFSHEEQRKRKAYGFSWSSLLSLPLKPLFRLCFGLTPTGNRPTENVVPEERVNHYLLVLSAIAFPWIEKMILLGVLSHSMTRELLVLLQPHLFRCFWEAGSHHHRG